MTEWVNYGKIAAGLPLVSIGISTSKASLDTVMSASPTWDSLIGALGGVKAATANFRVTPLQQKMKNGTFTESALLVGKLLGFSSGNFCSAALVILQLDVKEVV